MLKLHYYPGACSLASHIALEEAGAKYEAVAVDLAKGEHKSDEFLAINPAGEVPVLTIAGEALTQNVAILYWIARSFPDAGLLPDGELRQAQALSLMSWMAASVHAAFKPQWAALFAGEHDPERGAIAGLRAVSESHLERIDAMLAGKEWLFGRFGVADALLLPFYQWAADVFRYDMSKYPHYTDHYCRLSERPAVARVLAREAMQLGRAA